MYKKVIENGYIIAFGAGIVGTDIADEEYAELVAVFNAMPRAKGKGYRLKTDLTWEEYDLPVPSDDDEISDEEALSIIMGGAE